MKFFKKLLLIWMIVWLPAAGALAAVMPLQGSINAASASISAFNADEDASVMPCHGNAVSGKIAFGQGCSHCVLCHLAGALVMPTMPVIATLTPTHIFATTPLAFHPSFVAELSTPPPRPALA